MKSRFSAFVGGLLCCAASISAATAAPMTQDFDLGFSALDQSLFGPGQSLGSLAQSNTLNLAGFHVTGSSSVDAGTVDAHVNGQVSVGFDNAMSLGAASNAAFTFNFSGAGSSFTTGLGAAAGVTAGFTIPEIFIPPFGPTVPQTPVNIPLLDLDYSLDIDKPFTAALGGGATGSDSFAAAQPGTGPDIAGLVAARAGVSLNVVQSSTLDLTGLHGTVSATNLDTSSVVTGALSIGPSQTKTLTLDLSEVGTWQIELLDLTLWNVFDNTFSLGLDPFAYYVVGVNCGTLTNPNDNGFGCIANSGAEFNLATFPLFSTDPFALAFNMIDTGPFLVEVFAPTAAAEPATAAILAVGLAGLGFARRRAASSRVAYARAQRAQIKRSGSACRACWSHRSDKARRSRLCLAGLAAYRSTRTL